MLLLLIVVVLTLGRGAGASSSAAAVAWRDSFSSTSRPPVQALNYKPISSTPTLGVILINIRRCMAGYTIPTTDANPCRITGQ